MGKDRLNFWYLVTDLGFQESDPVVCLFETQVLIEFQVLFDVQTAAEILHADVVHIYIIARGHRPHSIEYILGASDSRDRVDNHVCAGKNTLHRGRNCRHHLFRALESYVPRQANGKIGKIAVAGAANAHPVNLEQTLDFRYGRDDLATHFWRSRIEQAVNRTAS